MPNPIVWPAVALSAIGTWLLGGGALSAFSQGDGLVALSALFWAMHVVVTGRASLFRRPIAFTAVQFAVVAALAAVCSALMETTTLEGLQGAAIDIAYVGLLSSALTFTILTVALQHTPPSEAAVIVSMETVFAATGGLPACWASGLGRSAGWARPCILGATLLLQLWPALVARRRATPPL